MAAMANSPLLEQLGDVSTTDARKRCGGVPQGLLEGLKGGHGIAAGPLPHQCHPLSHPAPASRPAQGIPARIPPCPAPSPTYERLPENIAKRMRMSHVDQPLMLNGAPGPRICQATASPAPAQDVARRILGEDVTQIDDYTERVKRMVGKVHLQRHHPLRPGRLRPCGRRSRRLCSCRAERWRA